MKYKQNVNKLKKLSIQVLEITIGTLFMALATVLFLLPNKLSTGGFTGIATVLFFALNIPIGITILILNIPLMIIGFFRLGKEFLLKSIIGTILLSVFIELFENSKAFTNDRFLASIYGGILIGVGTAIILRAGGTTGGSDLVSTIVKSYKRHYQTGNLIMIIDIVIVTFNVFVFKEIEVGLYSAIAIYLMGLMIDIVFEGVTFTKQMFIISSKYEEISNKIGSYVKRGSTGIYAKGMFNQDDKMILFCVGSRRDVIKIKQIAIECDKNAFIVISNARETWGKGFKKS